MKALAKSVPPEMLHHQMSRSLHCRGPLDADARVIGFPLSQPAQAGWSRSAQPREGLRVHVGAVNFAKLLSAPALGLLGGRARAAQGANLAQARQS